MTTRASDAAYKRDLIKLAEAELQKINLRHELPHLHSFKPYKWTLEYWNSTNRKKFICAGNQVSKSSTQIRHCIDLATDRTKWKKFFPLRKPRTFWYVYPDQGKVAEEVLDKWEKEFLPRGASKESGDYAWKYFYRKGEISGIHFTGTGVKVYFKTWKQDHQSGTIDALFVDEELEPSLYEELIRRLTRYDGLFSMVYTATKGYPFWMNVIEKRGQKGEIFPEADKWQVSMEYDCEFYADGTPSPWTPERVAKEKAKCGTEAEVNKRIHGRYTLESGRKYPSFSRDRNVKPAQRLDLKQWDFFSGVDIGTGGENAHPAAITVIAVNKARTFARVVRHWRGDDKTSTDSSDILDQFIELTKGLPMNINYYDHASREFYLRASKAGIPFSKANKSHDHGEDLINILFKNDMMVIDDIEECEPLIEEYLTLKADTPKRVAKDDSIDSHRYAVSSIDFDLSGIVGKPKFYQAPVVTTQRTSRHVRDPEAEEMNDHSIENDIDEMNDLLGD